MELIFSLKRKFICMINMKSRIGNSLFFIGLILLTLATIVGMPLAVPIGGLSVLLVALGWWMWGKKSPQSTEPVPLSQKSAKIKLITAVPACVFLLLSFVFPQFSKPLGATGLFLLAYAIAGLLEILIDRFFPNAKTQWELMAGWKNFLVSVAVIIMAILFSFSIIFYFWGPSQ